MTSKRSQSPRSRVLEDVERRPSGKSAFKPWRWNVAATAALSLLIGGEGCRSHFIEALVVNDTGASLRVVELDYPGASFGVSTLAPHAQYTYRFKLLGSGPLSLSYTDAKGGLHAATGPSVKEGQQGGLVVHIQEAGAVHWEPSLRPL